MQSESFTQQIIALVLAIAAVVVLLIIVPRQHYVPEGIVLPAQTVRAATTPDDVSVYQKMPLVADNLGYISIEMHATGPGTQAQGSCGPHSQPRCQFIRCQSGFCCSGVRFPIS